MNSLGVSKTIVFAVKQNVSGTLTARRQIQTEYRGLTSIVSALTLSLFRMSYVTRWYVTSG